MGKEGTAAVLLGFCGVVVSMLLDVSLVLNKTQDKHMTETDEALTKEQRTDHDERRFPAALQSKHGYQVPSFFTGGGTCLISDDLCWHFSSDVGVKCT